MTLMFSLLKVFLDARLKYYASPIGVIINSIWIDSQIVFATSETRGRLDRVNLFKEFWSVLLATGKT